jgi:hypothetical protein
MVLICTVFRSNLSGVSRKSQVLFQDCLFNLATNFLWALQFLTETLFILGLPKGTVDVANRQIVVGNGRQLILKILRFRSGPSNILTLKIAIIYSKNKTKTVEGQNFVTSNN